MYASQVFHFVKNMFLLEKLTMVPMPAVPSGNLNLTFSMFRTSKYNFYNNKLKIYMYMTLVIHFNCNIQTHNKPGTE
jgi:hypothetical protein